MKYHKRRHEITEGANHCSNCAAKVSPPDQVRPRRFLNRALLVLLIAVLTIATGIALGGCSKPHPAEPESPTLETNEKTDWISMLRQEIYTEDSRLSQAMERAVKMKLVSESDSGITIEVTAPDVSEKALDWFQSVSETEYSDAALEELLIELMEGETYTASYLLPFDAQGKPYITSEFLDAASCGTRSFYSALTAMFIEEMEERVNE